MLDPGRLRTAARLERPGRRTATAAGGWTQRWQPVANGDTWVELTALQGNERLRAMQTKADQTHLAVMRYRPDVRASWRLVVLEEETNPRYFLLVSPPVDPDGMHEQLQLQLREA